MLEVGGVGSRLLGTPSVWEVERVISRFSGVERRKESLESMLPDKLLLWPVVEDASLVSSLEDGYFAGGWVTRSAAFEVRYPFSIVYGFEVHGEVQVVTVLAWAMPRRRLVRGIWL